MSANFQRKMKLISKKRMNQPMPEELDNTDFVSVVAHHDAEIRILGDRMSGVESSIGGLGNKIDHISESLNQIVNRPQFSWTESLSVVKDLGILVGFTVAAIIYVASGIFESRISLIQERQETRKAEIDGKMDTQARTLERIQDSRWSIQHHQAWCEGNKATVPGLNCEIGIHDKK